MQQHKIIGSLVKVINHILCFLKIVDRRQKSETT
jgi:hypothetical protein